MNTTRYIIKGRSHANKINSLYRRNIPIYKVSSESSGICFTIESKHNDTVLALCEEMCYNYEIISERGLSHIMRMFLSNKGLVIGAVVSIALIIVSSIFVWDIEIIGTVSVDSSYVEQVIVDTGLNLFDLKSTCDTDKLEDNILAIEGIASVSVQLDGVRLMVYISEELPPPVIENRDVYEPIIAEYDSIITRLIVLSGTALVEVGDTVYKGQVLIAPYMSDGNTLDPSIQEKREKIYADGQIYGRIWLSKSAVINDEKLVTVRTGEFVQEVNVHYLLDFNSKISVPYLEYEKEIKITQLNAVFPLNIAYTTYYETKQQLQPCNIEVETNNAIALSYLKLTEIAQGQILRQWHTIKKTDNGTIIEVVAETIQRIDGG